MDLVGQALTLLSDSSLPFSDCQLVASLLKFTNQSLPFPALADNGLDEQRQENTDHSSSEGDEHTAIYRSQQKHLLPESQNGQYEALYDLRRETQDKER